MGLGLRVEFKAFGFGDRDSSAQNYHTTMRSNLLAGLSPDFGSSASPNPRPEESRQQAQAGTPKSNVSVQILFLYFTIGVL